jgi:hypothetical protein
MVSRKKRRTGLGCVRIFIVPHMLVGIGLIVYLLFLAFMALAGEEVSGRVVAAREGTDDDGDPVYTLEYQYRAGGGEHRGSSTVSREVYRRLADGGVVRVVTFPPAPGIGSGIAGDSGRGTRILFMFLFALFWNGILSVFVWQLWVAPALHRRLYRVGTAAAGTVTGKKVVAGDDSDTCMIHYRFAADGDAVAPGMVEGSMAVRREDYDGVREGDQLTVLYSPGRPRRSILYRFGEYDVARGAEPFTPSHPPSGTRPA